MKDSLRGQNEFPARAGQGICGSALELLRE
jgi:hypothetical protein